NLTRMRIHRDNGAVLSIERFFSRNLQVYIYSQLQRLARLCRLLSKQPNLFAMAIHQHLPRAILAHQNLVILQLYSRLSHNIAGIVELPLRLVKHVFTDLADIADEVREKSIAWIKPPVRHDGVQFRQLALMRFYERQLIWRDVVLQINWL